jgi:hypothetical protein
MNSNANNIWQRNGGEYNRAAPSKLAFLTRSQQCRFERLRQAGMIFRGQHREYFLDESRTQFDFPEVRVQGVVTRMYAMWNVLGLISNKGADLLFGEKPSIRVDDEPIQAAIDGIAERSALHMQLHGGAVDASWAGETYLEIVREGAQPGVSAGLAYIRHVPASEIYPLGERRGNGQYAEYVRYAQAGATLTIAGVPSDVKLLLETHYTAGRITRKCFKLKATPAGSDRDGEISIDAWPAKRADGSSLPAEELTGLSRPSIVWIANQLVGGCACSDYDGLIEQQDVLNAKHTQIARVHAKHSDPKLMAPARAADEHGNLRTDNDVLFVDEGAKFEYLTWDAKLELAHKDRAFALHALCTQAEFPASVLGLEESAADDSARKIRLKAMPALAKTGRKAPYWQAGITLAISIALEAETGSVPAVPIAVEMRDGLPVDQVDLSNEISSLRSAGAMSVRRSLQRQGLDRAAIEEELAELQTEAKRNMPNIVLGEQNETDPAIVAV